MYVEPVWRDLSPRLLKLFSDSAESSVHFGASAIAMPDRCTWCVCLVKVKVILPELSAIATPVAVAASDLLDVVLPLDDASDAALLAHDLG